MLKRVENAYSHRRRNKLKPLRMCIIHPKFYTVFVLFMEKDNQYSLEKWKKKTDSIKNGKG